MNEKDQLLELLSKKKVQPLTKLSEVMGTKYCETVELEVDQIATPIEPAVEKTYSLVELIDINDKNKYIVEVIAIICELKERSGHFSGEEQDKPYIRFRKEIVDKNKNQITFKGKFDGDILQIRKQFESFIHFVVIGISKEASDKQELYQALLVEGYILEKDNSMKMAFFTYFTAIESFISLKFIDVKKDLFKELHYSLDHLDLVAKVNVLVRHNLNNKPLNDIALWGEFKGLLEECRAKRNDIAHGKINTDVQKSDVDKCFLVVVVLISMVLTKKECFSDIREYLYSL